LGFEKEAGTRIFFLPTSLEDKPGNSKKILFGFRCQSAERLRGRSVKLQDPDWTWLPFV
jgi:hypothetical protein